MGFNTKQVHAGVEPDPVTGSILTPIYQTTTYVQPSVDEYLSKGYSYSRTGQPDRARARAEARGARGRRRLHAALAPGMAAIQAVLLSAPQRGRSRDRLRRRLRRDVPALHEDPQPVRRRVHVRRHVESRRRCARRCATNTKLILTETPANPTLKLTDIAAVSEIARSARHPARRRQHLPDARTTSGRSSSARTSSIHSTTKYFDGHNATVGGAVVVRTTRSSTQKMRFVQNATGMIMSPHGGLAHAAGREDALGAARPPVGERAWRSRASSSRIPR